MFTTLYGQVQNAQANRAAASQHVFVFIHSWNTSFEFGVFRAAQLAHDISQTHRGFSHVFVFSWPAGETINLTTYARAQQSVLYSVPHLIKNLESDFNRAKRQDDSHIGTQSGQ